MCLILLAWRQHPQFPLLVAANRDEFHDRPTARAAFWQDAPLVCAGRDLQAGGSWLGITRTGRFAAVTNFRGREPAPENALSRGELVRNFLTGSEAPEQFLSRLQRDQHRYAGFNLLFGHVGTALHYFCNRGPDNTGGISQQLDAGVHGLSNHHLNTDWPKLSGGKQALTEALQGGPSPDGLLMLLSDRSMPADAQLPQTGVGLETERLLAPRFIRAPHYGTRASTVIMLSREGEVSFDERAFDASAEAQPLVSYRFALQNA